MRIVHVGNFSNLKYGAYFYSIDRKISLGLIRNDHYVYDFSYRDIPRCESLFKSTRFGKKIVNSRLIDTCNNIAPHLLLLGHSESITVDTLAQIKEQHPQLKIAMWYVDPLYEPDKISFIHQRMPFLDLFFATTGGELLQQFGQHGTGAVYLPNIVDHSIESAKSFEKSAFDWDFVYCGRDSDEPHRKQFLLDLNAQISPHIRCRFCGCLGNPLVLGYTYMQLLSQSRMGLNLSRRNDIELYSSDRIAQLTGSGVLTFCPKTPKLDVLYAEDEVVYFDNLDDLADKILFYRNDKMACSTIAGNGWRKTHQHYNSKRITQFMVDVVFQKTDPDLFTYPL